MLKKPQLFLDDCLSITNEMADKTIDIILCDPPYGLGSDIIIKKNGKPDYAKASDFMDKWDMPTGRFWESFFFDAFRVLKHGGYLLMFGMDRQLLIPKYYATMARFQEKQSIYWYFMQNFPKSSDLSKNIDKHFGAEREVVGKTNINVYKDNKNHKFYTDETGNPEYAKGDITAPSTDMAKKYEGYKYSTSPLKQNCETIMVFQKPHLSGSCLQDTIDSENGNQEVRSSALNIDLGRVPILEGDSGKQNYHQNRKNVVQYELHDEKTYDMGIKGVCTAEHESGRYPAQTFVDENIARVMGETSKILHTCKYEKEEHDIFIYSKKVSKKERGRSNHPTMKPVSLMKKILELFVLPDEQVVYDPFMGSGTTGVACRDFENVSFIGCEKDENYFEIAEKRMKNIKNSEKNKIVQLKLI